MKYASDSQSEIIKDEMYTTRQVGVRRTKRKKIILSVVILAFVIGVWQFFRQDGRILRVEEPHLAGINGVRAAMKTNRIKIVTNRTAEKKTTVHVTDGPPIRNETNTIKIGILINSDNDSVDETLPLMEEKFINKDKMINSSASTKLRRKGTSNEMDIDSRSQTEKFDVALQGNLGNVSRDKQVKQDNASSVTATYDSNMEIVGLNSKVVEGAVPGVTNGTAVNLLNLSKNETIFRPIFNYIQPRYSASTEGQFQLMKFINDSGPVSTSTVTGEPFPGSFSDVDKARLALLSMGQFREIYSIQYHEHLRLVAFDAEPTNSPKIKPIESCPVCATIKKPTDFNEVLAFHVDRTLGVDRALPVAGRNFRPIELENLKFEEDQINETFPVMWFASDLIHQGDFQPDQNSVQLNWKQYQEILRHCQQPNSTNGINCTEIEYSDWSRMAVLDFVMQNHDRLDRYCCGYRGYRQALCIEQNDAWKEIDDCEDIENRFLVHILVSKSDPGHLVLLDNAGDISVNIDNLNYEILEGIRTVPQQILLNINSEDFHDRLMSSLRWDPLYVKSLEEEELTRQVDTITERIEKLQMYIKGNNITSIPSEQPGL